MVSSNRQALKANWEECTAEPEERKEVDEGKTPADTLC